ncbi:MAG: proline dehydrogenase family protein [Armatimonadota bacterium]|nr:proline dehydrogenase family protein [Armatimonadota bacterium]MDR7485814.1 proline dehydrogenase family protein [Armatimonadota bacterium]MDR7532111.1 proline dehydrogenase family protein [Armatimonadota bacterium]MDR7536700.1 proline dehydrogenase family protein [Armatimonadota bacterium]
MVSVSLVLRRSILAASRSARLARWMRRYGMRLGAARFVAGETLDECVAVLRRLQSQGFKTNTTLLGEAVRDEGTVQEVAAEYLRVLDRVKQEHLRTNLSVKLTHLGLEISEDLAYATLERLVARAADLGNFVRIDMEESCRVDATLAIYRRLRARGFDNVGVVLQAYLYRSEADLRALLPLRPNLRLVKGAYLEPAAVAFPRKADVDRNFIRLIELALTGDRYTAVATHDERVIEHTIRFARERGIATDRFEFQMLYGVRPQLQLDLVRRGFTVLVATPYGTEWYPYLMRRLAERPANVLFLLRNLLRR